MSPSAPQKKILKQVFIELKNLKLSTDANELFKCYGISLSFTEQELKNIESKVKIFKNNLKNFMLIDESDNFVVFVGCVVACDLCCDRIKK